MDRVKVDLSLDDIRDHYQTFRRLLRRSPDSVPHSFKAYMVGVIEKAELIWYQEEVTRLEDQVKKMNDRLLYQLDKGIATEIELVQAKRVLSLVEWIDLSRSYEDYPYCPWCKNVLEFGHQHNCPRQVVLDDSRRVTVKIEMSNRKEG